MTTTRTAAAEAEARAVTARELLSKRADALQDVLRPAWDTDREIASQNASMVQGGAGWLGGITGGNKAVADAERELGRWAEKWRPVVPELTDVGAAKRYAARHPGNDAIDAALHDYARGRAEQAMPIEVQRVQAAETAAQLASEAAEASTEAIYQHQVR